MASVLDFLGAAMMDGDSSPTNEPKRSVGQRIEIERISPDPNQPRRWFDDEKLENLAESIRQMDLLQPILVREDAGQIIIIDGERRWRAAKLAGLKDVPVTFSKEAQARILLAQVVANENRESLADIELAKVLDTLRREFKITGRELGRLLNRTDAQISRLMLLVKNPEIQQLAEDGVITCAEHAALFAALDPDVQVELVADARRNQTALTYQNLIDRKNRHQAPTPIPDTNTLEQPVTSGEEKPIKTKGADSLTLTPAQFSALLQDNPSILDALTSITLKAQPDLIADLSGWCSVE